MANDNQTMIQYFEWNIPPDGLLWRRVAAQAHHLRALGVDIMWLPPAYKGASGIHDVGYGVYDTYDLGEFDQKGAVRTKYGNKDEFLRMIDALHENGIAALGDIVLNHRIGADETEMVEAEKFDPNNRMQRVSGEINIKAWTKYNFPGRAGKYSNFTWDWTCFTGIDWDENNKQGGIYQFEGKEWSQDVDREKGNFDYLMGADVDMNNPKVVDELITWGKWFLDITHIDGFRLDAVKHIDYDFYEKWLDEMRKAAGRNLFAVGEYWSSDLGAILAYLNNSGDRMSLFDVPLHMKFFEASKSDGNFDMGSLFENTLVKSDIMHAVTFVDNHDSQPGQALESWVAPWFKPLAYTAILLRRDGLPCVFFADLYGLRDDGRPPVIGLKRMMAARRKYAYGDQHDYFDHAHIVGWTREGDLSHPDSGCAVLMSDAEGGEKTMYIGKTFAGQEMRDITRRVQEPVLVDADGNGLFKTPGGGVSVWVGQAAYADIVIHYD